MKIIVKRSLCQGHARCNAVAPELYPLDDLGYTDLEGEVDVPEGMEEAAWRGVRSCPEGVISVVEN